MARRSKKEPTRRLIKCEPMDPEQRKAMIKLVQTETKLIKSDAICGPGPRQPKK